MQGLWSAKDPWKKKNDGPPNLDELLGAFFSDSQQGSGQGGSSGLHPWFIPIAFMLAVVLWFAMGFFLVRPAEEGVLLRFGRYTETLQPGLHWHLLGVDTKLIVNTSKVEPYEYQSRMLTEDENYAKASLIVYYRLADPKLVLFSMEDPRDALRKVVASSLRQVVGHTHLQGLLTTEKEMVRLETEKLIRSVMEKYNAGLEITDVKLQEITVPDVVIEYFDDVIKAREEKAKKISEGERYVKEILPRARGQAERIVRQAQAYKEKVVLDAHASVAKFLAVLPQFIKHPSLTANRLFFESMNEVLPRVKKVFVNGSKQMFYLPLDGSVKTLPAMDHAAKP